MINSIVVATSNSLLVTTLALLATYALSRYPLVGKENIFFWTITNRMAPPAVFLLPLFLLYTQALRHRRLEALRHAHRADPALLRLQPALRHLDAARHHRRASRRSSTRRRWSTAPTSGRSLTRVIIPLARPGLAVTAILTWVFAWNEYLFAATLTSVHARTITTGLAEFVTVTGTNWGQLAATAMLTMMPALVVPRPGAEAHRRRPDLRRGQGVDAAMCRTAMTNWKRARAASGFLPIHTNAFDRVFIGIVVFVAIHLFWMRFLEAHIRFMSRRRSRSLIGASSSRADRGGARWSRQSFWRKRPAVAARHRGRRDARPPRRAHRPAQCRHLRQRRALLHPWRHRPVRRARSR